jgi:hypothetical protein
MTLSPTDTQHNNAVHYADCSYAACPILFIVMLSVIMLNVVILSVIMLNVVILSVIILNVIILSVIMLNFIILSVIMLNFIILSVIMLNFIILSVIMLNVVMLSVVAPKHEAVTRNRSNYDRKKFYSISPWKRAHEGIYACHGGVLGVELPVRVDVSMTQGCRVSVVF